MRDWVWFALIAVGAVVVLMIYNRGVRSVRVAVLAVLAVVAILAFVLYIVAISSFRL
jgi:hypothetical protein